MPRQDTTNRFRVEPTWPNGGYMVTKPLDDRNYDVAQYTGYSYSTVRGGNWVRGGIIRQYQPIMRPPFLGYIAYDPTNPMTWGYRARG